MTTATDAMSTFDATDSEPSTNGTSSGRKRGRPLEMQPEQVLELIRELGGRGELFRVHRDRPSLYARARRLFGSWSAAVQKAGFDYVDAIERARQRSLETRRRIRESGVRTAC